MPICRQDDGGDQDLSGREDTEQRIQEKLEDGESEIRKAFEVSILKLEEGSAWETEEATAHWEE